LGAGLSRRVAFANAAIGNSVQRTPLETTDLVTIQGYFDEN
jgi:hypothetical protein